ncbi:uncharacterized protein LOC121242287 [Juglans microcarpa x Juglans regia]|uniref:uncharacterized protein LOC121242287 n=1 Tax=Juglans microcarpa x Juglans regia TaxID=2249226 RepID=UPI001B7ED401|nr:uncharacterized protein LOC121242287 [Juglans microcarpa x Juglans regia]
MKNANQEKTAFITDRGLYCYKVMPFSLKNTGATYQRLLFKKAREWDARCEEAFSQLKEYLVKPPLLNHTKPGEPLSLCLAVTLDAVFAALAREVLHFKEEVHKPPKKNPWQVYVDELACRAGGGVGVYIVTSEGKELYHTVRLEFKVTNNEAEYEAVLAVLAITRVLGGEEVEMKAKSQVVVGQITWEYLARGSKLIKYLHQVQEQSKNLKYFRIEKIPRGDKSKADRLACTASAKQEETLLWKVDLQAMARLAIGEESLHIKGNTLGWATNIKKYLETEELPSPLEEAIKLKSRATRFTFIDGVLYRQGFSNPLLRCVTEEEAEYVMREIHALIQGAPPEELRSITSPWPFAQWGVDLVGPIPPSKGRTKFIIAAVDYFTKWAKAEAMTTITIQSIAKLLWKAVICRFGIPQCIIFDNGRQFDSEHYRQWCVELGIKVKYSSPSHSQANKQVEVTNKTIMGILKKKIGARKRLWADKLLGILWAYITTAKTSTGQTPFALAYGSEVMAPVEVGLPSHRRRNFDPEANIAELEEILDLLEEIRAHAEVRVAASKKKVEQYFNK